MPSPTGLAPEVGSRNILTAALGHPCPLWLLHNLSDLGSSRWQRLLRWLRRRGHPYLRYSPKARTSHGPMLAQAQAVDHKCAHATWWVQGADQRVKKWGGEAVGYSEG